MANFFQGLHEEKRRETRIDGSRQRPAQSQKRGFDARPQDVTEA